MSGVWTFFEGSRGMREVPTRPWPGIPTGFRPKAQGCEERATLGNRRARTKPQRGCASIPSFAQIHAPTSHNSSGPKAMDRRLWWRGRGEGRRPTEIRAEVSCHTGSQPRWGCDVGRPFTQGRSCLPAPRPSRQAGLATLGFGAKSLWDFFSNMSKLQSPDFPVRCSDGRLESRPNRQTGMSALPTVGSWNEFKIDRLRRPPQSSKRARRRRPSFRGSHPNTPEKSRNTVHETYVEPSIGPRPRDQEKPSASKTTEPVM